MMMSAKIAKIELCPGAGGKKGTNNFFRNNTTKIICL
jgi:hypothetical protein